MTATLDTNALICEALGLDPNSVSSLTLTLTAGNLPLVTVCTYADEDRWVPILETYRLTPNDPDEAA